jgi:hypothetical protein
MGQIQDKCSCLFNREEANTVKIPQNPSINEIESNQPLVKQISFKDKLLKSRSIRTIDEMINDDNIILEKPKIEDEYKKYKQNIQLVIAIQKIARGFLFRKSLQETMIDLNKYETDLIDKTEETYYTMTLRNLERESDNYSKDGYKKFYPEETDLFDYDYGLTFNVKINLRKNFEFYKGNVNIAGEKHGYGELINLNQVIYQGFWKNNVFEGWGKIIKGLEGLILHGLFRNGKLNGKGERINSKGSRYNGDFVNDLREGRGVEETNEHIYTGEYKLDRKNGKGKLTYKKIKDEYEGDFTDNCITGHGYYMWANKDTYKGQFVNAKMHGKGYYKWPDGGEYTGEYINNIKEGSGVFIWANGKRFEGPFKNGRPHGAGKLIYSDKTFDVVFENGKLPRSPLKKNGTIDEDFKVK